MVAARVCPMCESRKVRSEHPAPRTLITVCNDCLAVCTIQLSHSRAAESATHGNFFEAPVLRHTPRQRS